MIVRWGDRLGGIGILSARVSNPSGSFFITNIFLLIEVTPPTALAPGRQPSGSGKGLSDGPSRAAGKWQFSIFFVARGFVWIQRWKKICTKFRCLIGVLKCPRAARLPVGHFKISFGLFEQNPPTKTRNFDINFEILRRSFWLFLRTKNPFSGHHESCLGGV